MSNTELKKIKGRVQNKHKTEEAWLLDVYPDGNITLKPRVDAFIPLDGELIIYDPDSVYTERRIKIGDGRTNVVALPFYQGNPAELLTESKEIVGAINEVNNLLKGNTAGTWVFKAELTIPNTLWGKTFYFPFSIMLSDLRKTVFNEWRFWDTGEGITFVGDDHYTDAYSVHKGTDEHLSGYGWFNPEWQTVEIYGEPNVEFNTWKDANAVKTNSHELETASKNVVDAINETFNIVKDESIKNVLHIDTCFWGTENVSDNGDSITWDEGFGFMDENGNQIAQGSIAQRIPLVAGKNVTFSYDEENNAIAINEIESVVGTWEFNNVIEVPNKNF